MARQPKAWMTSPEKKPKSSLPDSIKTELETKANDLIVNVLKPKHVLPPKEDEVGCALVEELLPAAEA